MAQNDKMLFERYQIAKRELFDAAFAFLNDRQKQAVFTTQGPLLVLAGAGTGKTTVLVNRVAQIVLFGNEYYSEKAPENLSEEAVQRLIDAKSLPREEMLSVLKDVTGAKGNPAWTVLSFTFTNKAANEMKTRLEKVLGEQASELVTGTFHSVCVRILRRNAEKLGYGSNFVVYDADDSKKLLSSCAKQLNIDEKILPDKLIMRAISGAKDNLQTPEEFDASVAPNDFRMQQISSVYALYQRSLIKSNAMDFDDLIMNTVILLQNNPDVLDYYAKRFKYVLVDEYQDTNRSQFVLTSLLAQGHKNLMVVGDDDQSIYKFRGATIENILNFDKNIDGVKIIKLEENYRSTSNILNAANSVIRHNFGRRGKELWSSRGDGDKVLVKKLPNQNDEGKFIVNKIMELKIKEKRNYSDFAVLYRTNAQSNSLESVFLRSGVPYKIFGGLRFFERKEIKDILAYLSVINNPNDNLRLKRIINEPKRKIGDSTVNAVEIIAENTGNSMFYVMEHANEYTSLSKTAYKFKEFVELIHNLQAIAKNESLSSLFTKTIELSGYRQMLLLAEENGEPSTRRENVDELISTAIDFEKSHENPTLAEYLEENALIADIDGYNEGEESVSLMTVHSAKGLEFPVVFLPGMEEGLFPSAHSSAENEQLEEERRLAYVAITRAKDKLFILNVRERLLMGKTQYNQPSRFLSEIPEQYKVSEEPPGRMRLHAEFGEKTKKVNISKEFMSQSSLSSSVGKTQGYDRFVAGDRVSHITFGAGTIISAREMGADILYEVAFDKVGTKKLMATYAKLKRI